MNSLKNIEFFNTLDERETANFIKQSQDLIILAIPFTKCDREKDYEIAWAEFEKRASKS